MSSSSESENELAFDNLYREDGVIEPFRFEPLRSEMEVDEGNGASSSTLQADDTVDKREWCYCKKCEQSDVIKEKVCCLNPKVFENDVFENHLCITETEAFASVCLNGLSCKLRLAPGIRIIVNLGISTIKTLDLLLTSSIYPGVTDILEKGNGSLFQSVSSRLSGGNILILTICIFHIMTFCNRDFFTYKRYTLFIISNSVTSVCAWKMANQNVATC